MAETRKCPQCGSELSAEVPQGLCPECLLKAGLTAESNGGRDDQTPRVDETKYVPRPAIADSGSETLSVAPAGIDPESSVPAADQPVETTLRHFGDYELLEEIARGGMGVVYKARQLSLNRIVALKMILSGQLAGEEEVKRFHMEAEAAAKLDHPGIVPIYEVGDHEGQHYFSMGFVEGRSLAARVVEGPLPEREVVELTLKLSEAISYAHSQGVIHRDVKPSNVLLDSEGQPRITDFGLAKRIGVDSGLTATGQVVGTPSFMSPEQAVGDVKSVGERADVYSLGATLYMLLTGRPPFQASTSVETLRQVRETEPVTPRRLNAAVDRDLETVCLKCLEKNPEQRYRTAADLEQDLRSWLDGEPIRARPIGPAGRMARWSRRQPVLAGALAAIALSLIAGTLVSLHFAFEALEKGSRLEAELYVQRVNLAYREWQANDVGRAKRLLDDCPKGYRGWEWFFCYRLCHQERFIFREHQSMDEVGYTYATGVLDVAFHPDGERVASAGADGQVLIWETRTGKILDSLDGHEGKVIAVAFSPDGGTIASGGEDGVIRLWLAEDGSPIRTLEGHEAWVIDLAFSPDGGRIASGGGSWGVYRASNDYTVRIWDVRDGRLLHALSGHSDNVFGVAFGPKGRRIATGGQLDGTARVWDTVTGELVHRLDGYGNRVCAVAFDASGRFVAVGGDYSGDIALWRFEDNKIVRWFRGHSSIVRSLAFSADGERLSSASEDNTVKLWDANTGRNLRTFRGHEGFVNSVSYDTHRGLLASASDDATVRIWDTASGDEFRSLRGHTSFVDGVAVSPDGTRIVSGSRLERKSEGELIVWDAATGKRIASSDGDGGGVFCVAYNPDGREIVSTGWGPTVRFWDPETCTLLRRTRVHTARVYSVAFHPGGRLIASGGDDPTVKIWEAATGKVVQEFSIHGDGVRGVDFSHDGTRVALIARDDRVTVWDTESGRQQASLEAPCHPHGGRHVTFSDDGRFLAAACRDSTVRLWRSDTWQPVGDGILRGHTASVSRVVFSPDGTRLASAAYDKTTRLWDTTNGQELFVLRGSTTILFDLTFSPDGDSILSAGVDRTIRIWSGAATRRDG